MFIIESFFKISSWFYVYIGLTLSFFWLYYTANWVELQDGNLHKVFILVIVLHGEMNLCPLTPILICGNIIVLGSIQGLFLCFYASDSGQQKNALPGGRLSSPKKRNTLDCFILRSLSFFTNSDHPQSRVTSAHSWYLASFVYLSFCRFDKCSSLAPSFLSSSTFLCIMAPELLKEPCL